MARLISVYLTQQQVRDRIKTVTRRAGWWEDKHGRRLLQPGDHLTLCEKVMGRRRGEPLVRITTVEVVDVRRERLHDITDDDVDREGFGPYGDPWPYQDWWPPGTVPPAPEHGEPSRRFVEFFTGEMGGSPDQLVTRIEWRYLDEGTDQ